MPIPFFNTVFRLFDSHPPSPSLALQHTSMRATGDWQQPDAVEVDSHDSPHVEHTPCPIPAAASTEQGHIARRLPASPGVVEEHSASAQQGDVIGARTSACDVEAVQATPIASATRDERSLVADAMGMGASQAPHIEPSATPTTHSELEKVHTQSMSGSAESTSSTGRESVNREYREAPSPSPQESSSVVTADSTPTFAELFAAKRFPYHHLSWPPHAPKARGTDTVESRTGPTATFRGFGSQRRPEELAEAFNERWKHDKFFALSARPGFAENANLANGGPLPSPPTVPRSHGPALAVTAGRGSQGVVHVDRKELPSVLWSANKKERDEARARVRQELRRQLRTQGKQPGEGTWTDHGVQWTWTAQTPGPNEERVIAPTAAAPPIEPTCPNNLPFNSFPFLVSYLLPQKWRDKSERSADSGRDFNKFYQDVMLAAFHHVPETGERRNIVRMGKIELNLVIPVYMKPIVEGRGFVNPFPQFELLHRPREGWNVPRTMVSSGPARALVGTASAIAGQKRDASDSAQPIQKAGSPPIVPTSDSRGGKRPRFASSSTSDLRASLADKLKSIDRWTTICEELPENQQLAKRQIARIEDEIFDIQARMREEKIAGLRESGAYLRRSAAATHLC